MVTTVANQLSKTEMGLHMHMHVLCSICMFGLTEYRCYMRIIRDMSMDFSSL